MNALKSAIEKLTMSFQGTVTSPMLKLMEPLNICKADHAHLSIAMTFYYRNNQVIFKWDPLYTALLGLPLLKIMDKTILDRVEELLPAFRTLNLPNINSRSMSIPTDEQRHDFLIKMQPYNAAVTEGYVPGTYNNRQFNTLKSLVDGDVNVMKSDWSQAYSPTPNGPLIEHTIEDSVRLKEYNFFIQYCVQNGNTGPYASFLKVFFPTYMSEQIFDNEDFIPHNARKRKLGDDTEAEIVDHGNENQDTLLHLGTLPTGNNLYDDISSINDSTNEEIDVPQPSAQDSTTDADLKKARTSKSNTTSIVPSKLATAVSSIGLTTENWDDRDLESPISREELVYAEKHPNPLPKITILNLYMPNGNSTIPLTLALVNRENGTITLNAAPQATRIKLASQTEMVSRPFTLYAHKNIPPLPEDIIQHFELLPSNIVHFEDIPATLVSLHTQDGTPNAMVTYMNYLESYYRFTIRQADEDNISDSVNIKRRTVFTVIADLCIPLDGITAQHIVTDANMEILDTVFIQNGRGHIVPNIEVNNQFQEPTYTFSTMLANIFSPPTTGYSRTVAPIQSTLKVVLAAIQRDGIQSIGPVLLPNFSEDNTNFPLPNTTYIVCKGQNMAIRDTSLPRFGSHDVLLVDSMKRVEQNTLYTYKNVPLSFPKFAAPFREPTNLTARLAHINENYKDETTALFTPVRHLIPTQATRRPLYYFERTMRLITEYNYYRDLHLQSPPTNSFDEIQYIGSWFRYEEGPNSTHDIAEDVDPFWTLYNFNEVLPPTNSNIIDEESEST